MRTKEEQVQLIKEQLEDLTSIDLMNLYKKINSWCGWFDFIQCYELEDLVQASYDSDYIMNLIRAVVYGNVDNINNLVRYDGYGNLESVNDYKLEEECNENIGDLAEYIYNDLDNNNISYIDYLDLESLENSKESEN